MEPKKAVYHILAITLIIILFPLSNAPAATEHLLTGKTMGTFYRIKFLTKKEISPSLWQKKVDMRLREVNARLSVYQKQSEISRFNRTPENTPFRLSKDFYRVLVQCRDLHIKTRGAWDGTVKPLVDLWGFGTRERSQSLPTEEQVTAALSRVGFNRLTLDSQSLTKSAPDITLDLGSIAKGYGVDEIARLFEEGGIHNFLVEIGGELVGRGRNKQGKPWAVGITRPRKKELNPGLVKVVALDNMAIATSGNYRNFFELRGRTYSHIIHPVTGFPVDNQVVSASVIAENCTLADGLATALMVMDRDEALALVNGMEHTECLILHQKGKKLVEIRSKGFATFEIQP